MRKLLGITVFLLLVYVGLMASNPGARSVETHRLLAERVGQHGILTVAVGLLIVTGGIDLSMGSLIALCSTVFGILIVSYQWSIIQALAVMLLVAAAVGFLNGLIVTKLRLQPFMVTLCGLFMFRSMGMWLAKGTSVAGVSNRLAEVAGFYNGNLLGIPFYFIFFLVLAAAASIFLHFSVYGRYYFALGSNERAARFAGIAVDYYKVSAYVLCSALAGVYSFLNLMKVPSVEPSNIAQNYELFAIASAVLGGCTLRGGEGTIYGMVVGTLIIQILRMLNNHWGIPSSVEGMMIGFILLLGIILDEVLRWRASGRKN